MKLPIQYRILFRLTILVIIILFYDHLWEILTESSHLLLELSHQLFEVVEEGLDISVEFIFKTGGHTTQIIVFYILLAIFFYFMYRVLRNFRTKITNFKNSFILYWANEKNETLAFFERQKNGLSFRWQNQPANQKLKVVGAGLAVFSLMLFWLLFL